MQEPTDRDALGWLKCKMSLQAHGHGLGELCSCACFGARGESMGQHDHVEPLHGFAPFAKSCCCALASTHLALSLIRHHLASNHPPALRPPSLACRKLSKQRDRAPMALLETLHKADSKLSDSFKQAAEPPETVLRRFFTKVSSNVARGTSAVGDTLSSAAGEVASLFRYPTCSSEGLLHSAARATGAPAAHRASEQKCIPSTS